MKGVVKYYFLLVGFFLFVFAIQRLIFLLFSWSDFTSMSILEFLRSNFYAISLDLSVIGYFLLIPSVLMYIPLYSRSVWIETLLRTYFGVLLLFSVIVNLADIGLFSAWGTKVNYKAISYLNYPEKALTAIGSGSVWMLLLLGFVQLMLFLPIFNRIRINQYGTDNRFLKPLLPIALLAFSIIGLRGGIQELPISKSWVYFSPKNYLNLSATNGVWNVLEIYINKDEYLINNPYVYYKQDEVDVRVNDLLKVKRDTTIQILKVKKPNIVMVLLESWSAEAVEAFGGDSGVAPGMSVLAKQAYIFPKFYSTGFRTEQGQAAILTSFPAQPKTTIIRKFGKFDQLESLLWPLHEIGYSSTFYYGGDVEFANTLAFLEKMGFQNIYSEEEFNFKRTTKWGGYDEELFANYLKDVKNTSEPFFHILMTSTSHEPFNSDVATIFKGGEEADYRNTVHYTDSCLADFLFKAKEESWYDSTLFIILADHASNLPYKRKNWEPERHRIPFMLYGAALKDEFIGKKYPYVASHSDIPSTLLAQVGLSAQQFFWSKNLFNPSQQKFAFYTFDEGFGWITHNQQLVFDHQLGKVVYIENNKYSDSLNNVFLLDGKSYLQKVMDTYVHFNN